MHRRLAPFPRLVLLVVLGVVGSLACRRGPHVAELLVTQGTVQRNEGGGPRWQAAPVGQRFLIGDAVRTRRASTARLRLVGAGRVGLGPEAMVRFLSRRPGRTSPVMRVEAGQADLESVEEEILLNTALGVARLSRGGRLRVLAGAGSSRVEVLVGRAVLEREGAASVDMNAGQRFVVSLEGAILENPETPPPPPVPVPVVAPVAVDAGATPDAAALAVGPVAETGPGTGTPMGAGSAANLVADLSIAAGESCAVHDLHRETFVKVRTEGTCRVELPGRPAGMVQQGASGAVLRLGPGAARYEVQCGATRQRGVVRVVRDSGTAAMPRGAPRSTVDADGRRYTVLYQNRLPEVTFRWPRATATSGLTLRVQGGARPLQYTVQGTEHSVPSGTLPEGTYRFWFQGGDAQTRSPETTLRIDFDNASNAAQVREPPENAGAQGTVRVAGMALQGSTVTVGATRLDLDDRDRFAGEVPVPSEGALAIRIAHPAHGVHYYLRHLRAGAP